MNTHLSRKALRVSYLVMAFLVLPQLGAQTHFMSVISGDDALPIITTCDGLLVDAGGAPDASAATTPYSPGDTLGITVCPGEDETGVFLEWQLWDVGVGSNMWIYDGQSVDDPLLAFSALSFDGEVHQSSSSNESGCLTLFFVAGAADEGNFAAIVGCGEPCEAPIPVVNQSNPSPLYVCPGDEITFDGVGSVSNADILEYQWDFDADGTIDFQASNANATWSFDESGIQLVQLSLMDVDSCQSVQPTNYYVYISTDPVWNTSVETNVCTGEPLELAIEVEGVPYVQEPGTDFGEAIALPDQVGSCFTSEININSFLPGAVLLDAADGIESFMVNMEHSFLGDLDVTFICPNGSEMLVSSYNGLGPGTDLGFPIYDPSPDEGVGEDYFWSADATNGTWGDPDGDGQLGGGGDPLPSGFYSSETSWGVLDGCPLNGVWQLEICDLWASDNGFVFEWGIDFADSLYPVTQSFTPQFGLLCDSTSWEPSSNTDNVLAGAWNCADVTVTNPSPGTQSYTATAVNNFGCEYSQAFDVDYVEFNPFIESSADIFCGGQAVELEVLLSNGGPGDLSVTWNDSPYLSDTTGSVVYVTGMEQPQTFQATIGQEFDDYPGLLCEATATVTIGTCEITIPNVVSPYSSSGDNDLFRIPGIQSYPNVELTILNRWGNVVFESDDFGVQPFWDCAADDATSGVYFYVLKVPVEEGPLVVTDINGERQQYDGEGPFVFEGSFHIVD